MQKYELIAIGAEAVKATPMTDEIEVKIPREIWDQVDGPEIDFGTPNNQAEWAQYADRLRCALAERLMAQAPLLARIAELEGALKWIAANCARLRKGTDDWFDLTEIELVARRHLINGGNDGR